MRHPSLANIHVLELAVRDVGGSRITRAAWDQAKQTANVTRAVPSPQGRGTVITATDAVRTLAAVHGDRVTARQLVDGLIAAAPPGAVWSGSRTKLRPWQPAPSGTLGASDGRLGPAVEVAVGTARPLGPRLIALGVGAVLGAAASAAAWRALRGGTNTEGSDETQEAKTPLPTRDGSTPAPDAKPPATAPARSTAHGTSDRFRVASFNVLGASHTDGGVQHPTWRSGRERMPGMVRFLERHEVDVVGLQEFQRSQQASFRRQAGDAFEVSTIGANSIAWRRDVFRAIEERSLRVPYFEGKETDMPVVQLEHRATGRRAWFVNIHNPADTKRHRHQVEFRNEALRREAAFLERLQASGLPVYLVGDFNDRVDDLGILLDDPDVTVSAPRGARVGIDWVFASGPQRFTDHERDLDPIRTKTSDHPIVVAESRLD